jgi:hypothetical protein
MTRDDIIKLARQAGLWPSDDWYKEYGITTPNEQFLPELERFAALVAAAEREACAKVAESMRPHGGRMFDEAQSASFSALTDCAVAIRARGQA